MVPQYLKMNELVIYFDFRVLQKLPFPAEQKMNRGPEAIRARFVLV